MAVPRAAVDIRDEKAVMTFLESLCVTGQATVGRVQKTTRLVPVAAESALALLVPRPSLHLENGSEGKAVIETPVSRARVEQSLPGDPRGPHRLCCTEVVQKGELICVDTPLAVLLTNARPEGGEPADEEELLGRLVERARALSAEKPLAEWMVERRMVQGNPDARAMCRVYAREIATLMDETDCSGLGLYPQVSLANHSCLPSAVALYDAEGRAYLTATRNLAPGDEVTLHYAGDEASELGRGVRIGDLAPESRPSSCAWLATQPCVCLLCALDVKEAVARESTPPPDLDVLRAQPSPLAEQGVPAQHPGLRLAREYMPRISAAMAIREWGVAAHLIVELQELLVRMFSLWEQVCSTTRRQLQAELASSATLAIRKREIKQTLRCLDSKGREQLDQLQRRLSRYLIGRLALCVQHLPVEHWTEETRGGGIRVTGDGMPLPPPEEEEVEETPGRRLLQTLSLLLRMPREEIALESQENVSLARGGRVTTAIMSLLRAFTRLGLHPKLLCTSGYIVEQYQLYKYHRDAPERYDLGRLAIAVELNNRMADWAVYWNRWKSLLVESTEPSLARYLTHLGSCAVKGLPLSSAALTASPSV